MKYSIILLDYDPENKLTVMREECIRRIERYSTGYDYELIFAQDKGLEKSLNATISKATGDFIIHFCNDMMLEDDGWLDKLCQPHAVTGWKWTTFALTGEAQPETSIMAFEKVLWEQLGGFDEAFNDGIWYSDNDWLWRAREAGYEWKVAPINAKHLEHQTFTAYSEARTSRIERNKELFIDKWNLPR